MSGVALIGLACCVAGGDLVSAAAAGPGHQAAQAAVVEAAPNATHQAGSDRRGASARDVFVPPDRATFRLLRQAEQLIEQDRHAEAVRSLGAILGSPQDYFFQRGENDPGPRSLKSEAQRLLGELPPQGRELYELQFGARARQMLTEAAAARDADAIAEVSRRFFHTQAGYEATLLLGLDHFDHGRPLAGALALARLRRDSPSADQFEPALSLALAACWIRANRPDRAREVLSKLAGRRPDALARIAGSEVPLSGRSGELIERLSERLGPQRPLAAEPPTQWTVFRGNAARNASAAGDGPLMRVRWRVPTSVHPLVEALAREISQLDHDWDCPALPALYPLVVDDVVLMRTTRNLLAVDFATGKRLWEAPADDPLEVLFRLPDNLLNRRLPQAEYALRLRLWADATYGKMSSDGQCVFAVEDLGIEISPLQFHPVLRRARAWADPVGPKPYNRLAAYDVHTGKLKWHLGGPPKDPAAPLGHLTTDPHQRRRLPTPQVYPTRSLPQAGAFFLGPPLPLMGRLYVLAEIMSEIRLLVLDGDTGELLWSQQLAAADQQLLRDPLRRMAGISPSYADGILVCPTTNRSIVAVELATRSLLWGYTYGEAGSRAGQPPVFFPQRPASDPDPVGRWIDSSVVLAEGCALATPIDSRYLHCLRLTDGRLLWKRPRQDDLYLACVHRGKAILVGPRHVRALALHQTLPPGPEKTAAESAGNDAGEEEHYPLPAPAWNGRTVELPPGGTPSGMGFLAGDRYYLPLSNAQIVAIDLGAGQAARTFSTRSRQTSPTGGVLASASGHPCREVAPRQAGVPGNLACCRGNVISQSAAALEAFYELDALRNEVQRRLAAGGDDAEALALQGEILRDQGKLEAAIACFRRSYGLRPSPYARELLRDALFDGLQEHFAVHSRDAEEIQRLFREPWERATYLRLMVAGFEQSGQFRPAWEHLLELIDVDLDTRGLSAPWEVEPPRKDVKEELKDADLDARGDERGRKKDELASGDAAFTMHPSSVSLHPSADGDHCEMEPVEPSRSVRRDRWIQLQLAALREAAPPEIQAEIDRIAETRLSTAIGKGTPEAIERSLEYFGAHPIAERARRLLARQCSESGRLLSAERLLRRQERSDDPQLRASAVAQLAELLAKCGRWADAAVYYARLEREFADVACLEGKTGRQLVEELRAEDPVRDQLRLASAWPPGKVEVEMTKPEPVPPAAYHQVSLPFDRGRTPFFSDTVVQLRESPPELVGRDGLGNEKWTLPLAEFVRDGALPVDYGPMRVSACGHLLLLSTGRKVLAIDTLSGPRSTEARNPIAIPPEGGDPKLPTWEGDEDGRPPLLWSRDVDEILTGPATLEARPMGGANRGWALPWITRAHEAYDLARAGEVTSEEVLCFKRFRNCIALDPVTGRTLWVRRDLPRDGEVFGDHQYVFVVPKGQTNAIVLRVQDGQLLARREVPLERQKTIGRHVLTWTAVEEGQTPPAPASSASQGAESPRASASAPIDSNERRAERTPPTLPGVRPASVLELIGVHPDTPGLSAPRKVEPPRKDVKEDSRYRLLELVDPWTNTHVWPPRKFAAGATLLPVDDQTAAVREPEGRFLLIGLGDGQTMIEAKLDPPQSLPETRVFATPEQFVVLLYDRGARPNQSYPASVIRGVHSERVTRGRIYAFQRHASEIPSGALSRAPCGAHQTTSRPPNNFSDGRTSRLRARERRGCARAFRSRRQLTRGGHALWSSPVTIEDQWLPLGQPSRLPVLIFACARQQRQPNGRIQAQTSVLVIDKRTGRELCHEAFPGPTNALRVSGDPVENTVEIRLRQATITMTFTGQPLDPESPRVQAPQGAEPIMSPTAGAILRAIRRAVTETPSWRPPTPAVRPKTTPQNGSTT